MYSRVTIKDSKLRDLEIKDAVMLEGMVVTNSVLTSVRVKDVKNIE